MSYNIYMYFNISSVSTSYAFMLYKLKFSICINICMCLQSFNKVKLLNLNHR